MAEDDSEIPETGAVFTFGKSKFGDSAPNKFWIRDDKVCHLSCGDEHTGVVSESGKLFMFGSNEWGQLGLGHNDVVNKPSRVKALKKEKILKIACGRNHTLASTASGKVFGFGNNGEGQLGLGNSNSQNVVSPGQVQLPTLSVKMMSAGNDHSMLLTEDGDVYVWGGGSEGQLGCGEEEEVHMPRKLNLDEKIVCISCGYYHTAIVTASGKLLTCGEAEGGKLGLGECGDAIRVPTEVDGIDGKVVFVACGGSQTIAITEDGKAFSFGDGANGQLGHGTMVLTANTPQQITTVSDKFCSANCGVNHSAIISKKGSVYMFGDGRHGKLALGEENFANQFKPCLVHRFKHFKVESASCGGCHTLVNAVVQQQNGSAGSGYESGEDHVDNLIGEPARKSHLNKANHLYDSMDLEGSIGARNRRREKIPEGEGTIGRTLPPLNSSFSGGKGVPPLEGANRLSPLANDSRALNASFVPPIQKSQAESVFAVKKPAAKTEEESEEESEEGSEEGSEEESEEEKPAARQQLESSSRALPSPKPRPVPRRRLDPVPERNSLPPIVKTEEAQVHSKIKKAESDEDESGLSESEEEEPKHSKLTKKDLKKEKNDKSKDKSKKKNDSDAESEKGKKKGKQSEESGSEEDKKAGAKKSIFLKKKKKGKKDSEDADESEEDSKSKKSKAKKGKEDSEDEEKSEEDSKKKKSKGKDKDKKKAVKKRKSNIFGKKKVLDSDEDDEEDESEEDEEVSETESEKKKKEKDKKKGKEKDKKDKSKSSKEDEKKKEKEAKAKKEESEEEDSEPDEEAKTDDEDEQKDAKKETEKKEKKKSKQKPEEISNDDKITTDDTKANGLQSNENEDKAEDKNAQPAPQKKSGTCTLL